MQSYHFPERHNCTHQTLVKTLAHVGGVLSDDSFRRSAGQLPGMAPLQEACVQLELTNMMKTHMNDTNTATTNNNQNNADTDSNHDNHNDNHVRYGSQ